jgi:hypothetical protein
MKHRNEKQVLLGGECEWRGRAIWEGAGGIRVLYCIYLYKNRTRKFDAII